MAWPMVWPKLSKARAPEVSRSSSSTIRALMARFRSRSSGGGGSSSGLIFARSSNMSRSRMAACLMTSAKPSWYSRGGREVKVAGSMRTREGW